MITSKGKDNSVVSIHQTDLDNYEIEITDSLGNKSSSNISESQINNIARLIAKYNDLKDLTGE